MRTLILVYNMKCKDNNNQNMCIWFSDHESYHYLKTSCLLQSYHMMDKDLSLIVVAKKMCYATILFQ